MHHYFESITNTSGDALPGYFARVINPSNQNTVTLSADDNGTPIVTASGVENMAKTDAYGNVSFYVAPGTYHLDIYAPNATSFIMRVPNVAMASAQGPEGPEGPAGPSNNTRTTLTELKQAPVADATSIYDGALYTYKGDVVAGDGFGRVKPNAGTGAWVRSLSGDERSVSTLQFDAVADGASHPLSGRFATLAAARAVYPTAQSLADEIDVVAFESAIAECARSDNWPMLIVSGQHVFNRSVIINRPVDRTNVCDFRIVGRGENAGIIGGSEVAFFDTTLPETNGPDGPISEGISFEGLTFRGRGFFDMANVVTGKFLRVTVTGCRFFLCRLVNSETHYLQSYRVLHSDILNGNGWLMRGSGCYNIAVVACRAYAGMGLLSMPDNPRGANNVSITESLMEFAVSRMVDLTGVNGLFVAGNYLERGQPNNFNLFAGTTPNVASTFIGNIMLRPLGAMIQHNGGTTQSIGTVVSYSAGDTFYKLHGNANALDEGVSVGDRNAGPIHDASFSTQMVGVVRFGGINDTWTHAQNHISKSATGRIGFSMASADTVRLAVRGIGQSAATAAGRWYDSEGNEIASFMDDRSFRLPAIPDGPGNSANRILIRSSDGAVKNLTKASAPAGTDAERVAAIISALTNAGVFQAA